MAVQTLPLKPEVSVAAVLSRAKSPLPVPAWAVVVVLVMAGLYGYVSGRQNPIHHYVPYVGYPLVLDTTTGKACYSSTPKPSQASVGTDSADSGDGALLQPATDQPTGPAIPLCGK